MSSEAKITPSPQENTDSKNIPALTFRKDSKDVASVAAVAPTAAPTAAPTSTAAPTVTADEAEAIDWTQVNLETNDTITRGSVVQQHQFQVEVQHTYRPR